MEGWPYNDTLGLLAAADSDPESAALLELGADHESVSLPDVSDAEFYCDETATEEFDEHKVDRLMNVLKVAENNQHVMAERMSRVDETGTLPHAESFETIKSCSDDFN